MKNEFSKTEQPCIIGSINGRTDNEVIIESLYFWSDWTDTKKHVIELDKTIGFNIDFRLTSWHVIVTTIEKRGEYEYVTNELSHEVTPRMVAKMLADDRINILKISNRHSSGNFLEHLYKVMSCAKELRK